MRRGTLSFLLFLIVFLLGRYLLHSLPLIIVPSNRSLDRCSSPVRSKYGILVRQVCQRIHTLILVIIHATIPHGKPLFTSADLDPKSLSMGQDPLTWILLYQLHMKGAAAQD